MELASIHSARSLAPRNVRPAPECLPVAPATAAVPAEKHTPGETDPDGISPRPPGLRDRDASLPPPAHPRLPAYRHQYVPLLLLPAPAAASPAWPAAYRQSHPEKLCRDPPARTFQYAVPLRR